MSENQRKIKVIDSTRIDSFLNPIRKFFQIEASGGIILLIVIVISLIWANSPYYRYYFDLWNINISFGVGNFIFDKSLLDWINDGLMTIFFFLVGLEIKRELIIGELSSFKKAILPFVAALGGMIFPAVIYLMINKDTDAVHGWGIPVATDIAFSLGILSLLQKRVPFSLKVFLTAFAIIDDIGAVLIIAIFYTSKIIYLYLAISLLFFFILILFNLLHIRKPLVYIIPGVLMWIFMYYSGVHPTISGILLALTIPTVARIDYKSFLSSSKKSLNELENYRIKDNRDVTTGELNTSVFRLENSCEKVLAPAHRIEHKLHPYVAYFIIPLFAFANAGVRIEGNFWDALLEPVTIGIILGLFFGKQIGITLFSWFSIRFKISALPNRTSLKQIYGIGCLGGIGFTMSIFIANLAFDNVHILNDAKIGIILGSLVSGITGYITLLLSDKKIKRRKISD
jgi:Na+:H+ antiporter, NhaA family